MNSRLGRPGQALYLAERVDKIVVVYTDELFRKIKGDLYDKSIEQRMHQQNAEHNRRKQGKSAFS